MTFLSAATKNQQWKRVDFPQSHIRIARAMWMEGSVPSKSHWPCVALNPLSITTWSVSSHD